MLRLQEVRIKILGAVRKEHHESHQQKQIEAQLPLLGNSLQERTRGGRAMVPPGLRLWHLGADVEREQSGYSAEPKHRPPAPCGEGEAVGNRGEQIAHRVSILQNAAKDASPAARARLHDERCSDAPFAAHADAIEDAQNQEDRGVRRKAAKKYD